MSLTFNKQVKGGSNNQIVEEKKNNEQGRQLIPQLAQMIKGV
jgi:hypothetical protein